MGRAGKAMTTSGSAPAITLEQLFRYFQSKPHQLAAISELEKDMQEHGYWVAMRRDRPWFKTWSTDGKQPELNASPPCLRLTRTFRKDARGLDLLRLERIKNGIPMASLTVVSGAPGAQAFRTGPASKSGSLEPLPEGRWSIGDIEWAGGPDNYQARHSPGLGAIWVPLTYQGQTSRSAIGIHLDENAVRSPGTAGCVGLLNRSDEAKLVGWLRADDPQALYVDWGLGTCPRPLPPHMLRQD